MLYKYTRTDSTSGCSVDKSGCTDHFSGRTDDKSGCTDDFSERIDDKSNCIPISSKSEALQLVFGASYASLNLNALDFTFNRLNEKGLLK